MRQRLTRHLLAQIVCLGSHSITSLLTASGRLQHDWTADYRMYARDRVPPAALFAAVRQHLLDALPSPTAPALVALDDTHVRKSGRKVSGAKYRRDPLGPPFQVNLIWAQRFLQLSLATGADAHARMVPIGWRQAPTPAKPKAGASSEQLTRYQAECRQHSLGRLAATELAQLRSWMDDQGHAQRPLWVVVDGGYTNQSLLRNLPPRTALIGRIRADAKLFHPPPAPASADPPIGRPRLYGDPAPTPEQLRTDEAIPWQSVEVWLGGQRRAVRVKTLGPLLWRAAGAAHRLQLLVLAPLCYRVSPAGKHFYRSPAFLISTDADASPQQIIQRYVQRWDIENNFRDEKTVLGVGEAQVRDPHSVQNVTATAVAAYALLLAAGRHLDPARDFTLPRPRWRRKPRGRATTTQLIQQIREDLWGEALSLSGFASNAAAERSPENSLNNPFHAVLHASRYG
jgi:hypothetical protein